MSNDRDRQWCFRRGQDYSGQPPAHPTAQHCRIRSGAHRLHASSLPTFIPLSAKRLGDYQDSAYWRSMTISLAALRARRCRILLMPMCFSNIQYLQEIRSGLTARGLRVLHFCLRASEQAIESRLRSRGVYPNSEEGRWAYPRARQACILHGASEFAIHVPTDGRDPDEVGNDICLHIARAG